MHLLPRPGARALLAAACSWAPQPSAFAQQQQAPPQPPPQTPPAAPATAATQQAIESTGPARPLSIEEAVQLALQQNLGIQIERLNPELQDLHDRAGAGDLHADLRRRRELHQPGSAAEQLPVGRRGRRSRARTSAATRSSQKLFTCGTNATVSWDSSRFDDQQHLQQLQPAAERQRRRAGHASRCCATSSSTPSASRSTRRRRTARSPTSACSRPWRSRRAP